MRSPSRSVMPCRAVFLWSPRTAIDGRVEADHRLPTFGLTRRRRGAGSAPGHRRTPRRRQSGAAPRVSRRTGRRARRRRLGAGDERDQLAATAEQPVEHVGGDREQVVADDHEVAGDDAEHVAGLARPGHRHRLPGRDGDRALAGVPGGRGHLEDVLVEGAAGLVHRERGQSLTCAWVGITATRTRRRGRPRRCWRRSGRRAPSRGRWAARRPRRRRTPVIASSSWPVEGRWPGPPRTTIAPASSNSAARPGPAATATTRRPAPVGAALAALGDLVGEVGDPDPVRPAGRDAGLDRGADVVDVHVDVPEPLAADHDQRVAEPGEGRAQRRDRRRRRRRAGTSPRTPARPAIRSAGGVGSGSGCCGCRCGAVTGTGRRPVSTVSAASRITMTPRPPASTTPASRSTCSCSGVRASASRAAAAAAVNTSRERAVGEARRLRGRLGRGPAHREHGALDRRADRGVAGLGRPAQRVDHHRARCAPRARPAAIRRAIAPQHLAEDHPGVAAGAEQRAAGERREGRRRGRPRRRRRSPRARRRGRPPW